MARERTLQEDVAKYLELLETHGSGADKPSNFHLRKTFGPSAKWNSWDFDAELARQRAALEAARAGGGEPDVADQLMGGKPPASEATPASSNLDRGAVMSPTRKTEEELQRYLADQAVDELSGYRGKKAERFEAAIRQTHGNEAIDAAKARALGGGATPAPAAAAGPVPVGPAAPPTPEVHPELAKAVERWHNLEQIGGPSAEATAENLMKQMIGRWRDPTDAPGMSAQVNRAVEQHLAARGQQRAAETVQAAAARQAPTRTAAPAAGVQEELPQPPPAARPAARTATTKPVPAAPAAKAVAPAVPARTAVANPAAAEPLAGAPPAAAPAATTTPAPATYQPVGGMLPEPGALEGLRAGIQAGQTRLRPAPTTAPEPRVKPTAAESANLGRRFGEQFAPGRGFNIVPPEPPLPAAPPGPQLQLAGTPQRALPAPAVPPVRATPRTPPPAAVTREAVGAPGNFGMPNYTGPVSRARAQAAASPQLALEGPGIETYAKDWVTNALMGNQAAAATGAAQAPMGGTGWNKLFPEQPMAGTGWGNVGAEPNWNFYKGPTAGAGAAAGARAAPYTPVGGPLPEVDPLAALRPGAAKPGFFGRAANAAATPFRTAANVAGGVPGAVRTAAGQAAGQFAIRPSLQPAAGALTLAQLAARPEESGVALHNIAADPWGAIKNAATGLAGEFTGENVANRLRRDLPVQGEVPWYQQLKAGVNAAPVVGPMLTGAAETGLDIGGKMANWLGENVPRKGWGAIPAAFNDLGGQAFKFMNALGGGQDLETMYREMGQVKKSPLDQELEQARAALAARRAGGYGGLPPGPVPPSVDAALAAGGAPPPGGPAGMVPAGMRAPQAAAPPPQAPRPPGAPQFGGQDPMAPVYRRLAAGLQHSTAYDPEVAALENQHLAQGYANDVNLAHAVMQGNAGMVNAQANMAMADVERQKVAQEAAIGTDPSRRLTHLATHLPWDQANLINEAMSIDENTPITARNLEPALYGKMAHLKPLVEKARRGEVDANQFIDEAAPHLSVPGSQEHQLLSTVSRQLFPQRKDWDIGNEGWLGWGAPSQETIAQRDRVKRLLRPELYQTALAG